MPSVSMESLPDADIDHDNQALTRSSGLGDPGELVVLVGDH